MTKKIGVVTVTYNSTNVIQAFLDSILHQTYTNFILYVIDNVSHDDSLSQVRARNDSRVKIIQNYTNEGVAKGNNQGIQASLNDGCDLIMLLNNDVEFELTLFEKLVANLYALNASMIAPKMMYYPEMHLIWWAGTKFKKKDGFLNYHIGIHEEDKGQYNNIETMDYAPTCCVLMRKEVIEDIGLMDEKFFAYFDDTDFFYRIYLQQKHKLLYYPHVQFYHKVGGLSNMREGSAKKFKFNDFYIHLNTRNHIYYLRKQKLFISYLRVIFLFFRFNLRFFFSGKYNVNFKTFKLLNSSYFQGLKIKIDS